MPIINKNQIIYNENDWLAGLHPQDGKTATTSSYGDRVIPQKFGSNPIYQYSFNPFLNLGYASNGFLNRDIINHEIVEARLVAKANMNSTSFLALDNHNKIHYIYGYTVAENDAVFPHSITGVTLGASNMCYDIVKYGTYYYYAWKGSSTNPYADIGRYDGNSTFDDDFMSTVPTGHNTVYLGTAGGIATQQDRGCSLCVGYDDILYSGGKNYLSSFNAATNVFTREHFTIPSNYNIIKLVKFQPSSLLIFAQSADDCKVFFWDYLSEDPYKIKDLHDFEILSAFEYKGSVACMTQGVGNTKKIKVYDGSEFVTLAEINKNPSALANGSLEGPINAGVAVDDNEIYFVCKDASYGYIYQYGNNYGLKNSVNVIGKIDAYIEYINTYPGIISLGLGNRMLASVGPSKASAGSQSFTQQYFYETGSTTPYKTNYSSTGNWQSSLIDFGDERIQITGITVYFADEFNGGRTISMSLKDRYTTYAISGLTNLGTVTATNRIYRAKPILNTAGTLIPPLDGVGINLEWGAGSGSSVTPIINKVVLDYKSVTIN